MKMKLEMLKTYVFSYTAGTPTWDVGALPVRRTENDPHKEAPGIIRGLKLPRDRREARHRSW